MGLKIIKELIEKRDKFTKHYLLEDGSCQAVVNLCPVHYKKDGKYLDTNTHPRPQSIAVKGNIFDYLVDEVEYDAMFSRYSTGWTSFVFGNNSIKWKLKNANESKVNIDEERALYPDIISGVDLSYTFLEEGLKEDIIINNASCPNVYTFIIESDNCWPRVNISNEIEWVDNITGEVVFKTRKPVANDFPILDIDGKTLSSENCEADIYLNKIYDTGWEYSVILPDSWLKDISRTFPVVLDPSTTALNPAMDVYSEYRSDYPDWADDNFNGTHLHFGAFKFMGQVIKNRAFLKFDMPSLPVGSVISGGSLLIHHYPTSTCAGLGPSFACQISKVTASWGETSLTWNNQPGYSGNYGSVPTAGCNDPTVTFPINSTLLSDLYVTNHGICILSPTMEVTSIEDGMRYEGTAREYGAGLAPVLTINYNSPPNTPTNLDPGNTNTNTPDKINTVTPTLSWTYSDPNSDAQASFQILINRASDNVQVHDSGIVNSSSASYTVPGGVLAEGVKYYWRVKTKDSGSLWGGYATQEYIYTNRKPSATPVSPVGTSETPAVIPNSTIPTLDWTYSDPDSDPQASFQVVIKRASDNVTIRDTLEVVTGDSFYNVLVGDLVFGEKYYWQVWVKDSNGYWGSGSPVQYFICNQTSGKPLNLSPTGTSGDPGEITTLIPEMTWNHNDPESDAQYGFQVRIHRAADDVVIHDSGDVVSAVSSYNVPGAILLSSTKYWWEVRTKDTGSQLYGPYSDQVYIYTNAQPLGPTNLLPINGAVFDATNDRIFTWTFQDPDKVSNGDYQTAFQLVVLKVADGLTAYDSGKVVSGTASHTIPGGTLTNGMDYQWKVKCWDKCDVEGLYSDLFAFRTGSPPSLGITVPLNGGVYPKGIFTVGWSYNDPELDPQAKYRAILKDHLGMTLEDSGEVPGQATEHLFSTLLANATAYSVEVIVWDDTDMEDQDLSSFTTDFTPPTTPVIGVVGNGDTAQVVVTVTNEDNDPGKPLTDRNDLYRREDGGPWVRIASDLPKNSQYSDHAVASGVLVEYKAIAISEAETTAESDVSGVTIVLKKLWIHDVADPINTKINLSYATDGKESWKPDYESVKYEGRTRPVIAVGEMEELLVSYTVDMLKNAGDWNNLKTLVRKKTTLCIRDARGRKVFGFIPKLPEKDTFYGQNVALEIIETAYSEER